MAKTDWADDWATSRAAIRWLFRLPAGRYGTWMGSMTEDERQIRIIQRAKLIARKWHIVGAMLLFGGIFLPFGAVVFAIAEQYIVAVVIAGLWSAFSIWAGIVIGIEWSIDIESSVRD